jgi:solute carrier family 13 (sodium-dependent dicarboxylate transporter), member 2/3/5
MLVSGPLGGMSGPAWRTAAIGLWMVLWWITDAVPIAATALIPLVFFPLLGILDMPAAAAPYANPVIYLFFGGFILAAAFERSGLHRRLALAILGVVGTRPDRIVLGFMVAGGFVSMWVSNTAATLMMLPLVNSVLYNPDGPRRDGPPTDFERALLLSIAYAATIGGFGTLVGSPPNALLAGFLAQTHGVHLGFLDYMVVGVPIVVLAIPATWFILTRVAFRVSVSHATIDTHALDAQRRLQGPMTRQEKFVAIVGLMTASAWIAQPWLARLVPGLTEAGISVICAVALLVIPISGWQPVIDWPTAEKIPWGVLVLFGGGLSLAAAIQDSGLSRWIGDVVGGMRGFPPLLLILIVTAGVTLLTEFTSNTATAAAFLPIASSLAVGAGMNPLVLCVAAGLAASNGFMLPVGTPPNAIVFSSGKLTTPEMARTGLMVDVLFIVLITAASYFLVLPVLG